MDDLGIFMFGCVVFVVVIGAVFCALIASDSPKEE
jgi:hypothetical protein